MTNPPPMPGQYHKLTLDIASKAVVAEAQALVAVLGTQHGVQAIPILLLALQAALIVVLHAVTPLPEQNIKSVKGMLQDLTESIEAHYPCALALNGVPKTTEKESVM